jgi:hypothetical protein
MDNQPNAVPLTPEPPKKSKKWIFLLIGVPVVCICVCLIGAGVMSMMDPAILNTFNTTAPRVEISAGTYEGTVYTAPNDLFTCDYGGIMVDGWGARLYAEHDETGSSFVFTSDLLGRQYGVDYFNISEFFGEEGLEAISNRVERELKLRVFLEAVFLREDLLEGTITHQEYLDSEMLFATIQRSRASHYVNADGTDASVDRLESYYVFPDKEWVYFVYYYVALQGIYHDMTPSRMKAGLDAFYQGCEFQE